MNLKEKYVICDMCVRFRRRRSIKLTADIHGREKEMERKNTHTSTRAIMSTTTIERNRREREKKKYRNDEHDQTSTTILSTKCNNAI